MIFPIHLTRKRPDEEHCPITITNWIPFESENIWCNRLQILTHSRRANAFITNLNFIRCHVSDANYQILDIFIRFYWSKGIRPKCTETRWKFTSKMSFTSRRRLQSNWNVHAKTTGSSSSSSMRARKWIEIACMRIVCLRDDGVCAAYVSTNTEYVMRHIVSTRLFGVGIAC